MAARNGVREKQRCQEGHKAHLLGGRGSHEARQQEDSKEQQ